MEGLLPKVLTTTSRLHLRLFNPRHSFIFLVKNLVGEFREPQIAFFIFPQFLQRNNLLGTLAA